MMPLEKAVSALDSKLAAQPAMARPTAPAAASPQFYGTPAENSPPPPAATPAEAAPTSAPAAADKHVLPGEPAGDEKNDGRLKFDFNALNKRAIKNSQRLAQDSDSTPGGSKSGGGWFGKKQTAPESGKEAGKTREDGDWTVEYLAEDSGETEPAGDRHEPLLDEQSADHEPDAPVHEPELKISEEPEISEEDEMLLAIKQAIKPGKS